MQKHSSLYCDQTQLRKLDATQFLSFHFTANFCNFCYRAHEHNGTFATEHMSTMAVDGTFATEHMSTMALDGTFATEHMSTVALDGT